MNKPTPPKEFVRLPVDELLTDCSALYRERAAVYRDNYLRVGECMAALFPDEPPCLETADDHTRHHIFELAIVKLTRYAVHYNDGGHEDSLKDLIVYVGMLLELDRKAARQEDQCDDNIRH